MKEQNIGICCAVRQVTLNEFEKQVTLSTVSSLLQNSWMYPMQVLGIVYKIVLYYLKIQHAC